MHHIRCIRHDIKYMHTMCHVYGRTVHLKDYMCHIYIHMTKKRHLAGICSLHRFFELMALLKYPMVDANTYDHVWGDRTALQTSDLRQY